MSNEYVCGAKAGMNDIQFARECDDWQPARNPYKAGTREAKDWDAGYASAQSQTEAAAA